MSDRPRCSLGYGVRCIGMECDFMCDCRCHIVMGLRAVIGRLNTVAEHAVSAAERKAYNHAAEMVAQELRLVE